MRAEQVIPLLQLRRVLELERADLEQTFAAAAVAAGTAAAWEIIVPVVEEVLVTSAE